jgi:hypothetical protein
MHIDGFYFLVKPLTLFPLSGIIRTMADIYSVNEAAQKLGLDPSQVRRLLKNGKVSGKKLGHDWVVLSLDYKKKKFGVGRKPKVVVEPVLSKTVNKYVRLKYL